MNDQKNGNVSKASWEKVKRLIRDKIDYMRKMENQTSTMSFHGHLFLKGDELSKRVKPAEKDPEELITGNEEIIDYLNQYFGIVFTVENCK